MINPEQYHQFLQSALRKGLYVTAKSDIPTLVRTAVDGYGNDYPLLNWFDQGGDGTALQHITLHPKGWHSTWRANIADVFDQSIVLADSPSIRASIAWLPPHYTPASNLKWLMYGGIGSFFRMGAAVLARFDTYECFCNEQHFRFAPDAFYLLNLVVRRDAQGQDLGSHLLKTSLEILDAMDASAYLETHSPKNVAFYEHLGFRLLSDDPIPGTKLPHYAMMR